MSDIRVLILGTGGMGNAHAEAYAAIPGVKLVAGVDNNPDRLAAFTAKHGIAHGFASVDDALAWGQFDAVSNVTPDPVHHPTTLPLLAAGKHVLCEKPLAANYADAAEMAAAMVAAAAIGSDPSAAQAAPRPTGPTVRVARGNTVTEVPVGGN